MKGYTIQNSIELLEKKAGSGSGASSASNVSFDNTGTGLAATNVQGAITEVNSKIIGWGTPITATAEELAAFVAANDTYTAPATGLLYIECKPTQNAENYLYITKTGGQQFDYSQTAGNNNMLVIPVTQGDVLTILMVLKCKAQSIVTYPFALSAPATSTKTTRKKSSK